MRYSRTGGFRSQWATTKNAGLSCDSILKKNPDHEEGLLCHSRALAGLGLVDAAIAELREAGRVNPHSSEAWRVRAELLQKRRESDKALVQVTHALEIDPHDSSAQSLKGEILIGLNRFDEARSLLSRT